MAQTANLVFNGGAIPSPAPTPSGSGKAKLLKIGEITITEQGEQVTKKVICDPDSVTTVAPFMEVLTSAKLAELVEANNIIVLDDGDMQYLMADTNVTVEDGTQVCTAVNFLGLSKENRAKVAYNCTRITDELTLQQVVEVGEPIETNFNLVIADSDDTAPDTLIDKMEVVDSYHDPDDPDSSPMLLQLDSTVDGQGNHKVAIDESELSNTLHRFADNIDFIEDRLAELPSDEHGYFNSSLYTTPGDGTTTNLAMNNFRISENRDVHGNSIDFVPTHQEGGVDFGEVYLEPGTYILAIQYILQWVGNPRGTFLPIVTNVADQPFDFSYEHEDVVHITRIVTRATRARLVLNIAIDADTPQMNVMVRNLEVVQVASYNHPPVTHDTTLTGSGELSRISPMESMQWSGKKWYAYGTSITDTTPTGKYAPYLAQMSGMILTDKGIGGGGIGDLGGYSRGQVFDAICNITDGKTEADLITLETGANDTGADIPLGTIYDTTRETLAGCLNICLRYLQANTNAQIAVMPSVATTATPNESGQYYKWQLMIRDICTINRVFFIEPACNLGYGKLTGPNGSLYVADNIHQTSLGGYILAEAMWEQIKRIPNFRIALPT